jgi:hypothetical protein
MDGFAGLVWSDLSDFKEGQSDQDCQRSFNMIEMSYF